MIVRNVNSGLKAGYSLSGTVLTLEVPEVGSLSVDLQEKQQDTRRTLDYSLDRRYEHIADGVGSWYVATVVVPAAEKELQDTGQLDEEDNPIMEEVVLPLDTSKVELHLWGLPSAISDKVEQNEEEEGEE